MTDAHVHMGWFIDRYHSPGKVAAIYNGSDTHAVAISSTSTCAEKYNLVIREHLEFKRCFKGETYHLLWITPKMLTTNGISKMLKSNVQWSAIKMHWDAHRSWFYDRKSQMQALNIIEKLNLPVIIHTGDKPTCHAAVFKTMVESMPHMTFVLAHGRPLGEVLRILDTCPNTMVDTAFMPCEDAVSLVKSGYGDRLLFGTDCPINEHFYPDIPSVEYISKQATSLRNELDMGVYNQITQLNFNRVFTQKH